MMTTTERDRLRALAERRPWTAPVERVQLFCDRCGAQFATSSIAIERPHCVGIEAVQ